MAYGVRWFSEFDDIEDNIIYRVEVLDRDYAGAATAVKSGGAPLQIEMPKVSNPFEVFRAQKASVQWISDTVSNFEIADLFITDDKKYQLKVYSYEGETLNLRWTGYLVPVDCEEPFASKPYTVNFSATCGLPFLRDDYFLTAFGQFVEGKQTLMQIIANCLSSTGLELPIYAFNNFYEQGMSVGFQSPFSLAEIDADGLRGMKAAEVLEGILAPMNSFITQANGVWIIKGVKDQMAFLGQAYTFSSGGSPTGQLNLSQAASFGRTPINEFIPNIRPTADVVERLAEPNSIVTETVSPGIPVNRLTNGSFSGAVLGGNIPGWVNKTTGGTSWSRDGAGTPEDPYKLVFRSPVFLKPKAKQNKFTPLSYFETGPIEINVGDFNISADQRKDVKIIFSGAFKSNNVLGVSMNLNLNENEREYASYLDQNGDWLYSKKEDTEVNITANTAYTNVIKTLDELDYQTFEVESKEITNLLKIGGEGVAQIRLRVFPGVRFPGQVEPNALLALEDLSITISTDLVYEGEHMYQVDGKLPIRNANELEYTAIIADKINIDTPEQKRDVNRVMTGYMTLVGGNQLTQAWVRYPGGFSDPADSIPEPIQKKSLRERIRLLCGKRRVIEGTFHGYGLTPDQTVINQYDDDTEFFTQTGWKWDVKNSEFDVTFHELDFTPLANEEVYLYDEEGGRRGNRMYAGSNSGTGTKTPQEGEPIILDDIPTVYFTCGEVEIRVVNLAELIESNHLPEDLEAIPTHYTDWISYVAIDRGEDGFGLDVQITGRPKVPGTDRILVELIGPDQEDYLAIINIVALPATKVTHTLINTGSSPGIIGSVPGIYELPDKWDVTSKVSGLHDKYEITIKGGGPTGSEVNQTTSSGVNSTELATYRMFEETDGITTSAGQFAYTITTYRGLDIAFKETIYFTLYDEEYLAKLKYFLMKGGSSLGEISPDGTSVFNNPLTWNVRSIVDDVEHDKAIVSLILEGIVLHTEETDLTSPELTGTYDVYGSDQELEPGIYNAVTQLYLEDVLVLQRYVVFEIGEKKPVKQDGLTLVEMVPNTVNYTTLGALPATGGSFELPDNWNALSDSESEEYDWEGVELFEYRAGSLVEVDIQAYTGSPQYQEYPFPITQSDFLAFGDMNSTQIGHIHHEPSTFRIVYTRRNGGQTGKVVAVFASDFSFGPAVDIGDVELEDPSGDFVDYFAGDGLSEVIEDFTKTFNVNVDDITIEITEEENWLQVKDKGITFEKIQDIPGMTLIGNLTDAAGTPYAVEVIELIEEATDGNILTALTVINYIADQLEGAISGTVGRIPKFTTIHELGDSIIREASGLIGIGIAPTQALHILGSALVTGQLMSSVATGTAPLSVMSVTLVTNLNADLLDGQHGPYYLDWDNFTNYKSVIAGVGMTGGGLLDADRTITMGTPSSISSTSTNSVSGTTHTHALATGTIIVGTGIAISGDLTNRLVDSGDITISTVDVPWGVIISRPTTLSGYGITDSITFGDFTTAMGGKENVFSKGDLIQGTGITLSGDLTDRFVGLGDVTITLASHTHTSSQITDFTSAVRGSISEGSGIDYNSTTGVITCTISPGTGDVTAGTHAVHLLARWSGAGGNQIDGSRITDDGITAVDIGGALDVNGRLEVNSTTGWTKPNTMTYAQRMALTGMPGGAMIYQTNGNPGTGSAVGLYVYVTGSGWWKADLGAAPIV